MTDTGKGADMGSVPTTKFCRQCQQDVPLVGFHRNRSKADGLAPYCKPCWNAYMRANAAKHKDRKAAQNRRWLEANRDRKQAQQKAWRKRNAERIKARNAAYREANRERIREAGRAYAEANRERRKADYAANPQPAKDRAKAWRERNPERAKARNAQWKARNPERVREHVRLGQARRRARKKNLPTFELSAKDFRRLLSSPCAIAGCQGTDIQIDHVIPVSRGGSHGVGNFQPLCASHNQSKRDKLWIEFHVYLKRKAELAA